MKNFVHFHSILLNFAYNPRLPLKLVNGGSVMYNFCLPFRFFFIDVHLIFAQRQGIFKHKKGHGFFHSLSFKPNE